MNIKRLFLKGIAIVVISMLGIAISGTQAFAQCFNAQYASPYPSATFSPSACNGTAYPIATDCYAGEYSLVAISSGNTYTFSSSTATDYISIYNEGGTTAYMFGTGPQTYLATFNGNVRFYTHTNASCGTEAVNRTRSVACQAPPVTVFYNNGATVFVGSGTILQANGMVVNNSGTLTNNGNLTVTGNLTNNGTITGTAGNLGLTGTTAQTLGGTSPVAAKNVVMNNAAGVTLTTPLRIDGAATFTSGIINAASSSYPVVFTANGSVSGTPTNASHVNGYVIKEGTGAFTFPLGNATNYQPVRVNLSVNFNGLRALYVPADAGTAPFGTGGTENMPLVQYNTSEYWNLMPASTAVGSVTIYYDSYRATPISNNTADLRVAHKYNGSWVNEGRTTGSAGDNMSGSIVSNEVRNWSPFTFGAISAVILPLQWLSITATAKEETKAQISWQVQEEKVKSYMLERSTDSRSFTMVATLASQGNGTHTYSYTDATAFSSSNRLTYYRILQQDLDGHTSYSKTVQVATSKGTSISVYPTPFHTSFVVNSTVAQAATLTDNTGKIVAKLQLKTGSNTVQGQSWPTGTYFLTTLSGETYKLLKD